MAGTMQPVSIFGEDDRPSINLPPPISMKGHQRSRTTVELPPIFSRTPSASPTRSSTFRPFHRASRAGSPELAISISDSAFAESQVRPKMGAVGKFTSWFEGTSEPVNITLVPSQKVEKAEPFYQVGSSGDSIAESKDNLTQRPGLRTMLSSTSANSSRFSFFKKASPIQSKTNPDDDLLHTDIKEALQVDMVEEITPETYYTLQQTAEALLRRFQLSYAENLGALRQITSAKNVQADELDAAQTRNDHLKLQLTEMAERAVEQEKAISSMREELYKHQQSIRMISEDEPNISRDYRRSRRSDFSTSGDSLFDSDISSAASVFSEADSIGTPATSIAPSPRMKHARLHNPTLRMDNTTHIHTTPVFVADCMNCHGVPASEAWDVIGMMKMESVGLKQRVTELEEAQDSALDFLNGLNV